MSPAFVYFTEIFE